MNSPSFSVSQVTEAAYIRSIYRLIKSAIPINLKHMSASHWLTELSQVSNRKTFLYESKRVAYAMVKRINDLNQKSWANAARANGITNLNMYRLSGYNSDRANTAIKRLVNDNAEFLSKIPFAVARQLNIEVTRSRE